jgi:hypothetical protein
MLAQRCKAFARLAAALILAVATFPAVSHQPESAQPATISSASVTATGTVAALTVTNQLTGATLRYFGLTVDQGGSYALNGPGLGTLVDGVRIEATGSLTGNVFNIQRFSVTAQASVTPRALVRKSVTGKLAVAHADYFAEGRGTYTMVVLSADGRSTALKLPVVPETIQVGMSVIVEGTLAADGSSLDVSSITIVAMPEASVNSVSAGPITNNVLVMVVKFTDSPASDAFSPATVNTEFQTKVAALYQEQSFGQQLLNVTIACYTTPAPAGCAAGVATGGWLKGLSQTNVPIATPASCNYTSVGQAADAAATHAGAPRGRA